MHTNRLAFIYQTFAIRVRLLGLKLCGVLDVDRKEMNGSHKRCTGSLLVKLSGIEKRRFSPRVIFPERFFDAADFRSLQQSHSSSSPHNSMPLNKINMPPLLNQIMPKFTYPRSKKQ